MLLAWRAFQLASEFAAWSCILPSLRIQQGNKRPWLFSQLLGPKDLKKQLGTLVLWVWWFALRLFCSVVIFFYWCRAPIAYLKWWFAIWRCTVALTWSTWRILFRFVLQRREQLIIWRKGEEKKPSGQAVALEVFDLSCLCRLWCPSSSVEAESGQYIVIGTFGFCRTIGRDIIDMREASLYPSATSVFW